MNSAAQEAADPPLVDIRDLHVHYSPPAWILRRLTGADMRPVRAVDGVTLRFERGEIVGLVGESGSGKSTIGRALLGLQPPTSGSVSVDGIDLAPATAAGLSAVRRRCQMIFQDGMASLSPRLRISYLLNEPYEIRSTPQADRETPVELLATVELSEEHAGKFPHQLSGGQARRVSIARALAGGPSLIVADEPTAGLALSEQTRQAFRNMQAAMLSVGRLTTHE